MRSIKMFGPILKITSTPNILWCMNLCFYYLRCYLDCHKNISFFLASPSTQFCIQTLPCKHTAGLFLNPEVKKNVNNELWNKNKSCCVRKLRDVIWIDGRSETCICSWISASSKFPLEPFFNNRRTFCVTPGIAWWSCDIYNDQTVFTWRWCHTVALRVTWHEPQLAKGFGMTQLLVLYHLVPES